MTPGVRIVWVMPTTTQTQALDPTHVVTFTSLPSASCTCGFATNQRPTSNAVDHLIASHF